MLLQRIVRQSLKEFGSYLADTRWRGREREAVSCYALGFLQKHFENPTRITIEGAVIQVPGRVKKQVCKDLIIWPRPGMTVWDDNWTLKHDPVCIMEWKLTFRRTHKPLQSKSDVRWLQQFADSRPVFEGFAVSIDLLRRDFLISATRVTAKHVDDAWLRVA